MEIKIKNSGYDIVTKGCMYDLVSIVNTKIEGPKVVNDKVVFSTALINLNMVMELPKYFEAVVIARSSLYKEKGVILTNAIGEIDGPDDDNSGYIGDNDIWKANLLAFRDCKINKGDRICQFKIQPSMKAPLWVKLKWLFTNKITFVPVESLNNKDRGGIGSTGGYKK
jgi:dUTP pyrophosphatase